MVAVSQIRLFVEQHRAVFSSNSAEVIAQAEAMAEEGMLGSIQVKELLGNELAEQLFHLVTADQQYVRAGIEAVTPRQQEETFFPGQDIL